MNLLGINMEVWAAWLTFAIVLLIAEVVTPGFVLACFSVGCVAAAAVSYFGLAWTWQICAFGAASVLAFVVVRPFMTKHFLKPANAVPTNTDWLIGQTATVTVAFDPNTGEGRVKVRGEDWRGVALDNCPYARGSKVIVRRVDGTRLLVEAVPEPATQNNPPAQEA